MIANVKINLNNPQAVSLLGFLETLPFAEVTKSGQPSKKAKKSLREGTLSLEEFDARFEQEIHKAYGV